MARTYGSDWDKRRAEYWLNHSKTCRKCGSKTGIVLHHKNYNYEMGQEPDSILVPLCRKDHSLLHRINRRSKYSLEQTTNWFLSSAFKLRQPTRRRRTKQRSTRTRRTPNRSSNALDARSHRAIEQHLKRK